MASASGALILVAAVSATAYGAAVGSLFLRQRQLLFRPDRRRPPLGPLAALGVRAVRLTTADGLDLSSWYLAPPGERPVIAYFHGNGGHIGHRAERLLRFVRDGYGVLMLEYRGYGGNPGRPSEAGFYADARAVLDFLADEDVASERIVLYGESLGSAVAVRMAAERAVGAVILESPFTSIAAVAQHHYPYVPVGLLMRDPFDAGSRIDRVRAPILMLQGGGDRVVPPHFGRALFDTAPEPKESWLAAAGEHEDLEHFGALDVATAFIERRLPKPLSPASISATASPADPPE